MSKKIYTGAYLLKDGDLKKYYGIVDGSHKIGTNIDECKLIFNVKDIQYSEHDENSITVQLSLDQLLELSQITRSVYENLKLLKLLSKRKKLNETGYIEE